MTSQDEHMTRTDCVFCTRKEQPTALFETPSLYVMPDKFPCNSAWEVGKDTTCYLQGPGGVVIVLPTMGTWSVWE